MPEPLQQVNVSLPAVLIAFIQRQAAQTDRTIGGMIRHLVAEAARREVPPERVPEVRGTLSSRIKWPYVNFLNAICARLRSAGGNSGLVKQSEIQHIANRATFLPIPKLSGIVNPAPRLIADDAMRFMEELVSADFGREREPSIAQRIAIGIARQLAMLIAGLLLQFQDLSPKLDGKWRYPPTRLSRNRRALRVHQTAPGLPAGRPGRCCVGS